MALLAACIILPWTLLGCWGIAWSPDGTRLVFTWGYGNGEKPGLAVMDVSTRSLKMLPHTDSPAFPQWSPKGDRIAYIGSEDSLNIYNFAQSSSRTIDKNVNAFTWSDDGRQIAYIRKDGGNYFCVRYDLASGKIAQTIPLPKGVTSDMFMSWLPKTDGVAFLGGKANLSDLYVAEFGEVRRITNTGDVVGFAVSQDGKSLVWARKSRNPKYILLSLYRYDLNLRSVERIPFPERVPQINPDPRHGPKAIEWVFFSPDLQHMILYLEHDVVVPKNHKGPNPNHGCMVAIRLDGSGAKTIADWTTEGSEDIYWPAFSWDSKRIAIQHIGSACHIITLDADGANKKVLLTKKQ